MLGRGLHLGPILAKAASTICDLAIWSGAQKATPLRLRVGRLSGVPTLVD